MVDDLALFPIDDSIVLDRRHVEIARELDGKILARGRRRQNLEGDLRVRRNDVAIGRQPFKNNDIRFESGSRSRFDDEALAPNKKPEPASGDGIIHQALDGANMAAPP